jgi:hypothetical protein
VLILLPWACLLLAVPRVHVLEGQGLLKKFQKPLDETIDVDFEEVKKTSKNESNIF